jgi:hypothetical protein
MKEIYLSIHLFWELQQKALQHIHPNICVADTAPIVKGYNYVMAQKITQMMYDEVTQKKQKIRNSTSN